VAERAARHIHVVEPGTRGAAADLSVEGMLTSVEADLAAISPDLEQCSELWFGVRDGLRSSHAAAKDAASRMEAAEAERDLRLPDAIEKEWTDKIAPQVSIAENVHATNDMFIELVAGELATVILPPYKEKSEQQRTDVETLEMAIRGHADDVARTQVLAELVAEEPRLYRLMATTPWGKHWRRVNGLLGTAPELALERAYEAQVAQNGRPRQQAAIRARGELERLTQAVGRSRYAVTQLVQQAQASRQELNARAGRLRDVLDGKVRL
jgi:hypothetical protein